METFGRLSWNGEIGQGNSPFSNLAVEGTLAEASSTVAQHKSPKPLNPKPPETLKPEKPQPLNRARVAVGISGRLNLRAQAGLSFD